ncbi:MAG: fatty acid desaturase [Acidobacteria bacterium]|nr:MAG: fatty acid desaturase [Acidobacteriota bacterium]
MSKPTFGTSTSSRFDEVKRNWRQIVATYQHSDLKRSVWQIADSVVPYLALWYLAYRLLAVSYWLALPVTLLAAGFMVRVFIIFHDCGHGSFFRSDAANRAVGFITGILTLTPYDDWREEHAKHHATAGDLDRRGFGDVWTMTVREYREAPFWQRTGYRLYRSPLIFLGVAPLYLFLVRHRLTRAGSSRRARRSVHATNLALLAIFAALFATAGVKATLLVELPLLAAAGAAGIWLFYVQHQFEHVYWARRGERDFVAAAMEGSSLYALPRVLQWFSGNIGFHHIHHLAPRIPNYRLPKAYREQPLLQRVDRLTLLASLRSLRLRLYDEDAGRLVAFREA